MAGRGSHLVTVNSYLAQRDAEWMGNIYSFLGLEVDVIDLYEPGSPERQKAYRADITYGTNNEFGFDYLRDNMVHSLAQRVQRGHHYAIIDEARTPLPSSSRARSGQRALWSPCRAVLAQRPYTVAHGSSEVHATLLPFPKLSQ
ncbi:MAG: hypothetical protein Q8N53_08865 [Longimicrobiales bacterium]|nr:hypothetical protein [Longimicrobiales bacterium]